MKKKSLYDIAVEKGFKTLKEVYDYADGKNVITGAPSNKGAGSGHAYPKKFKFKQSIYNKDITIQAGNAVAYLLDGKSNGGAIYICELYIDTTNKKELEDQLTDINEKYAIAVEEVKSKLNIMTELGIEEYEESTINILIALDKYKNVKPKERLKVAQDLADILKLK